MNIKPIRSKKAYTQAMARIDALWGALVGSPDGDELEVLAVLVERYEALHEPMPPSDPIAAIKFRMEQQQLTMRDLEPFIGASGRVSEVLNGKRQLSLAMIKRLHAGLRAIYPYSLGVGWLGTWKPFSVLLTLPTQIHDALATKKCIVALDSGLSRAM